MPLMMVTLCLSVLQSEQAFEHLHIDLLLKTAELLLLVECHRLLRLRPLRAAIEDVSSVSRRVLRIEGMHGTPKLETGK